MNKDNIKQQTDYTNCNPPNEEIEWLLEMLDPSIDDGYCQSVIDKLESLKK